MSDIIAGILKYAPHVRCFAIGSADLAKQNSEYASRKFPRPKRKQIAKNAYNSWTRLVKTVIDDVKTTSYETIVERLRSLPFSAMYLAFDAESAEIMIDKMADEIRCHSKALIGISEQFVSDDFVFVWLWID